MRQIMAFQGHIALIAYFCGSFYDSWAITESQNAFLSLMKKAVFVFGGSLNMRASHAKTLQGRWYKKTGDARRLRFGLFA